MIRQGHGGISIQISIDGPAGAGKSSIASAIARKLGFIHIDTGAMYRALTWLAIERSVDLRDADALTKLAQSADISFAPGGLDGAQRVFCEGQEVTADIRSITVSEAVSRVSAVAGVRDALVEAQRRLAAGQDVVMDGRDIGTVVLPQAICKIYLTASAEERARRRLRDREDAGEGQSLAEIIEEIEKRDSEDANRSYNPMRPAADSIIIDTTSLSFQDTLDTIIALVPR